MGVKGVVHVTRRAYRVFPEPLIRVMSSRLAVLAAARSSSRSAAATHRPRPRPARVRPAGQTREADPRSAWRGSRTALDAADRTAQQRTPRGAHHQALRGPPDLSQEPRPDQRHQPPGHCVHPQLPRREHHLDRSDTGRRRGRHRHPKHGRHRCAPVCTRGPPTRSTAARNLPGSGCRLNLGVATYKL